MLTGLLSSITGEVMRSTSRYVVVAVLAGGCIALTATTATAGDEFWPRGGGIAPAGDEYWPRGGGVAPDADRDGVASTYYQGQAPWSVSPASTDGYHDLRGVDPDYPLTGTVGALGTHGTLGDEYWPRGSG